MKRLDANPSRNSIAPAAPANLEGLLQSLTRSDTPDQQLVESLKCLGDFHDRVLKIADLLCDEQRRFDAESGQVRRELAELRCLVDQTRAQIRAIPAESSTGFHEQPPPIKPESIAADLVADAYSNNIDQVLDESYKSECPQPTAEPVPTPIARHYTLSAVTTPTTPITPVDEPPAATIAPSVVVIRCGGGVHVRSLSAATARTAAGHDSIHYLGLLDRTRKRARYWCEEPIDPEFESVAGTKPAIVEVVVDAPVPCVVREFPIDATPVMVFDDSEADMMFEPADEAPVANETVLLPSIENIESATVVEPVQIVATKPIEIAPLETPPVPEPKEEVQWMSHTRHDPPHRLPSAKFLKRGLSVPRDEKDTRILRLVAETKIEPRSRRIPTLRKTEEQPPTIEAVPEESEPTPVPQPLEATPVVKQTDEPKIRIRLPQKVEAVDEAPRPPARAATPKFSALKRKQLPRPEFIVPARWWSITPIVVLTVALVAGLTVAGADHWRATMTLAALEEALDHQPASRRVISEALRGRYESPLARHDSRRDYLVARAMSELAGAPEDSESGQNAGERLMAARRNVERAIERSPANVWYRLTLARFSDRLKMDPAIRTECWRWVQRIANPEPLYWRELAEHWIADGRPQQAIAAYRAALAKRPELTLQTLNRLTQSGIAVEDALRAVPSSPIAVAAAARFLKEHGHADWKPYIETRMTEARAGGRATADDLAADAYVRQLLGEDDAAIAIWQKAIAKAPGRREWQLSLAQLHYRREDYADSDRLAEAILRTDPAGPQANEARLLREKIELASGGKIRTAKLAAPTAN